LQESGNLRRRKLIEPMLVCRSLELPLLDGNVIETRKISRKLFSSKSLWFKKEDELIPFL
jgi:hypothetical protein